MDIYPKFSLAAQTSTAPPLVGTYRRNLTDLDGLSGHSKLSYGNAGHVLEIPRDPLAAMALVNQVRVCV